MPDEETVTVSRGAATLTIDLGAFAKDVWNDDEESYHNEVAGLVASRIARGLQDEIAKSVRSRIDSEVESIVREHLEGNVSQVSEWGSVVGQAKPLRDLIGEAVEAALRKPELRDGYSRSGSTTMVQRIIANEVEKAFKAEVKDHVKEAQAAAVAAVKASAAEVIAETIDRARRGLA